MTELFNNGFESGDFSAWTGTIGTPTIVETPVHHGSYAVQINANEYPIKTLPSTYTTVFTRIYVRVTNTGDSHFIEILSVSGAADQDATLTAVMIPQWAMWYRNNGSRTRISTATSPAINTWYCVESEVIIGAGNGEARMYVDGVKILEATGLTNNDYGNIDRVLVGGYGTNERFIDCVVVADAYIGQEAAGGQQLFTLINMEDY